VKPSYKSVGFALLVEFGFAYSSYAYFGNGSLYLITPIIIAVALVSTHIRGRGIREGLPPPYGRAKVVEIRAREVLNRGVLMVMSGILFLIVPLFLFYLAPGELLIGLILGLGGGLSLSEPLFFASIHLLERRMGLLIYSVDELGLEDGTQVLTKRIELIHSRDLD
jgi:hypothetical protein